MGDEAFCDLFPRKENRLVPVSEASNSAEYQTIPAFRQLQRDSRYSRGIVVGPCELSSFWTMNVFSNYKYVPCFRSKERLFGASTLHVTWCALIMCIVISIEFWQ